MSRAAGYERARQILERLSPVDANGGGYSSSSGSDGNSCYMRVMSLRAEANTLNRRKSSEATFEQPSTGPLPEGRTVDPKNSLTDLSYRVLCGDAFEVLKTLPEASVDMCMTSPPYWGHREYEVEGIGQEPTYGAYVRALGDILQEAKRVLKPQGSLWLNIGDSYEAKSLTGVPWRVALHLIDEGGWILRNDVIWNKVKGSPDNARDKLRNIHEHVFHFVKQKNYFYDVDAIRSKPQEAKVVNGSVISATGVSGVRYKRQIELSTALSPAEKVEALRALEAMLDDVRAKRIADFRMIIRGQQRTTHSDSMNISGRAKEIRDKGFYFLRYHPNGAKPSDVWDIIPEDSQKRAAHFAPYPADLCRIPILATCPPGGIVLDPFCGTGTTLAVAKAVGRSAIGIDISPAYAELTRQRLADLFTDLA